MELERPKIADTKWKDWKEQQAVAKIKNSTIRSESS